MYLALIFVIVVGLVFHFGVLNKAVENHEGYYYQPDEIKRDSLEKQYFARSTWF